MRSQKIDDMKHNIIRLMAENERLRTENNILLAALDTANQTIREAQAREFALRADLERANDIEPAEDMECVHCAVATYRPNDDGVADFVEADFARRLERERDEARELSEKRRKSLSDFIDLNNELRNERDEARAEVARLREEVAMMRECIISTEDTAGQRTS